MAVRVRIRYVDGQMLEAPAAAWPHLRADGVDAVWIGNPRETCLTGHSLYWLYPEGDVWVAGAGSLYPTGQPPEVLVTPDGRQAVRTLVGMPDLRHEQIKLGWWRPGEARP